MVCGRVAVQGKAAVARPYKAAAERPAAAPAASAGDVQLMRQAVKKVLDGHAGARKVFRYLRYLECDLRKSGAASFKTMPPKVLLKANAQLEALVSDWSAPGLTLLRSHLGAQIAVRAADLDASQGHRCAQMSDFHVGSRLVVDEGLLSEFLEFALSQPMLLRAEGV